MSIDFHIPGFARHYRLNLLLHDFMQKRPEYFREDVKIGSCYGCFPNSMWNGGRFLEGSVDKPFMDMIIKLFNERGIPIRYTFTNPMLKEEHMNDPFCNYCMHAADNGMNEVIVFSPILEEYIRKTSPSFKIISTTCKQIENMDDLNAEIEKDYKMVVLDYNWNNQFEELKKIKTPEKCEILVNAVCVPHCKRRKEHYESIGKDQIRLTRHLRNAEKNKLPPFKNCDFKCDHMLRDLYDTVDYPTHVSPEAIFEKYVPMGFKNFKIEGRSVPDINVLESFVYYLMKPEMRDKGRLEYLLELTRKVKYFP